MPARNIIKQRMIDLLVISVVVVCVFLGISGCSTGVNTADSEAGNPHISSAALIKMPSSIADSVNFNLTSRQILKDKALAIYDFIRLQNYIVNELVNGEIGSVRFIIESCIADLNWRIIKKLGFYEADSGYSHLVAEYNENKILPYGVLFEYTEPGKEWKVKSRFNGDSTHSKGWVYYFISNPQNLFIDSQEIYVSFDRNELFKTVEVEIDHKVLVDTGFITESFKYSFYQKEAIIHISGSSYHPFMTGILPDTTGHCYTYTAVVDTNENRAVVNLGLPPAVYADTTLLFTKYGVANIYGNVFINEVKKLPDDTAKMIIVTSYKDSLPVDSILIKMILGTITLHDASEIDSMEVDDFIFFLELNSKINDEILQEEYLNLLWILRLTQPVYFDKDGYVDNGETPPSEFVELAKIKFNRPLIIPLSVKELNIEIK